MFYKVFYTNYFIYGNFASTTYGPFIFMRPKRKGDIGLLEHEKVHVRQFWDSYGFFCLAYLFSRKKRLQYEVEGYREQLKYSPEFKDKYATLLSTKYMLKVTKEEALKLLE